MASKAQATSVVSVGSAWPNRQECPQCGRCHLGEYRVNEMGCFKCGSLDHFIRNCPEMDERGRKQDMKASSAPLRSSPQKNPRNGTSSRGAPRGTTTRSEGRAPVRTNAIRAREEAESLNVIKGTLSIYDITIVALIDPGSTYFYISNLMLLPFNEFNVILGMDWLTSHGVVVD
ncbi:uncharacterized protein LOC108487868 [Gossypium arboreum]|uniref:uncharacterized protein LOC108487868 n=1 Tax=Gossypium arboreum TaxID=29729 RepID=UPI000819104F|nr:uncharacterized protein LOC108487868 [Gossypium arboreum]